jgi:hypothetical protein
MPEPSQRLTPGRDDGDQALKLGTNGEDTNETAKDQEINWCVRECSRIER